MTNEQINIAIAEACGWEEEDNESCWTVRCWTRDELGYCLHEDELPNYCNDLNAMHEAEKTLILTKRKEYLWHLALICCNCEEGSRTFETTTSTARQRAEAFLKTIGKWEDAK